MNVIHLKQVDSTNDYILQHGLNLAYPVLVYADVQAAGKGRLGRVWSSDAQGFWGSYAWVWPKSMVHLLPLLSLHLGLLVHRTLSPDLRGDFHCFEIKWPNDLYLNGRKLGGILIETRPFNGHILVVIGLGVNFTLPSLEHAIGFSSASSIAYADFRARFIELFQHFSLELLLNPDALMTQLNEVLAFRGSQVGLTHPSYAPISGVLCGVNTQGFLQVDTQQGPVIIESTDWSMRLL